MVDPCERRLRADLSSAEFEAGVTARMWRLLALDWPVLTVAISAGDGNELGMRILVDGYPVSAPAGQPWDHESNSSLQTDRWPIGGRAQQVFNPSWSTGNGNAPYLACDRAGLVAHPNWSTEHPERAWNSNRTISFYLLEIHRELRGAIVPGTQP